MSPDQFNEKRHWLTTWSPYLAAFAVAAAAVILWYGFVDGITPAYVITSAKEGLPWIILILGISVAVLLGLSLRLTQLTRERKKSLELISEQFKKEISTRVHSEETKQKLEKALLQGQKLQAIGTLAGGIAHDFNNILYAIIGYAGIVREDVQKDSMAYQNLGKVLDAAKRGQELISRILTFSRRQHHEFEPICLEETIEGVLGLMTPTIPASVTINFTADTQAKKIVIEGNQTQLHQVLVNIINNSVDAMDGEGTINIKLSHVPDHDPLLAQFPEIQPGLYCRIDITDTGHGMDQATMARIFEPFYTTKEVGKGTGLGLATAHSIIKEHRGETVVESQLGHGTTFTLLLPEHSEKEENSHGKDSVS